MDAHFVPLSGGSFRMGSTRFYAEEGPVHDARVAPFQLARHAVTNRDFASFVAATGYRTVAERPLDAADFPGGALDSLEPGSLVFTPTDGPVDLRDWRRWWRWVPSASWRAPLGPGTDVTGKDDHPVVQVAFEDAEAYAAWAGARLPTEAEWEFAARGGLKGATYAWGEEPNDGTRANTWQGRFPYDNRGAGGWVGTAPVGSFPPNRFGLFEMTGNTWEWTSSRWSAHHAHHAEHAHCAPSSDRGGHHVGGATDLGTAHGSAGHTAADGAALPEPAPAAACTRVIKGGSHLCAPEYCLRYRPAARSSQTEDSATTHIGFRLARDAT